MCVKFKEQWNAQDEYCPTCKHVVKEARGLNKQNLKKLVFGKPSIQDWLLFFVIVMILLLAWRYNIETATCRDTLNHIDETCAKYKTVYAPTNSSGNLAFNFSMIPLHNAQT